MLHLIPITLTTNDNGHHLNSNQMNSNGFLGNHLNFCLSGAIPPRSNVQLSQFLLTVRSAKKGYLLFSRQSKHRHQRSKSREAFYPIFGAKARERHKRSKSREAFLPFFRDKARERHFCRCLYVPTEAYKKIHTPTLPPIASNVECTPWQKRKRNTAPALKDAE